MLLEIDHSAGQCFIHFSSSRLCIGASIVRGMHRVFQGSELNKACLNLFMEERKRAWSARPLAWMGLASGKGQALLHHDTHTELENSFRSLKRLGGAQIFFKRTPHSCESPSTSSWGKNSPCSHRPSAEQVPKSSPPGSPWSLSSPGSRAGSAPRAPPGRNPQGRGPWRWRLSDALLLTIAFLLPWAAFTSWVGHFATVVPGKSPKKQKSRSLAPNRRAGRGKGGCLCVQGLLSSSALLPKHTHTPAESTRITLEGWRGGSSRDATSPRKALPARTCKWQKQGTAGWEGSGPPAAHPWASCPSHTHTHMCTHLVVEVLQRLLPRGTPDLHLSPEINRWLPSLPALPRVDGLSIRPQVGNVLLLRHDFVRSAAHRQGVEVDGLVLQGAFHRAEHATEFLPGLGTARAQVFEEGWHFFLLALPARLLPLSHGSVWSPC